MAKKEEKFDEEREVVTSLMELIYKKGWSGLAVSKAMPIVCAAVFAGTLSEKAYEHKDEIFEEFMDNMKKSFEVLYKKVNEK